MTEEPKKTDTYGTNDGKNTVAHNKVSSFWTHVSFSITKISAYFTFVEILLLLSQLKIVQFFFRLIDNSFNKQVIKYL